MRSKDASAENETLSARMRRIRKTDTKPEMVVRRLAHRMGFRYRLHRRGLPGTPDLVFPGLRKVIFVHGCFWHQHDCRLGAKQPTANPGYWLPKLARNVERDHPSRKRCPMVPGSPLLTRQRQPKRPLENSSLLRADGSLIGSTATHLLRFVARRPDRLRSASGASRRPALRKRSGAVEHIGTTSLRQRTSAARRVNLTDADVRRFLMRRTLRVQPGGGTVTLYGLSCSRIQRTRSAPKLAQLSCRKISGRRRNPDCSVFAICSRTVYTANH